LRLGLRHFGVDARLLALEGRHVDRVGVVGAQELLPLVGELTESLGEEASSLRPMPLALGDLGPKNPLQSAPERRRDPDLLVEGLNRAFEIEGRNVPSRGAARASGVPPDAAEVPEAALGDRVASDADSN
jgi:hypothetical protein